MEVKLRIQPTLRGAFEALLHAIAADGRSVNSKWRRDGEDCLVVIPVKEAGAWMEVAEELADSERDENEDLADQLEQLADVIEEESSEILGLEKETPCKPSGSSGKRGVAPERLKRIDDREEGQPIRPSL